MSLYALGNLKPQIASNAWIAPDVQIIGNAQIDAFASVWFGSVIRADNDLIHIGEGSNIQDNCTLHVDVGEPIIIEPYVSIGHQAMLHACHVGTGSLIGMQSVLLSRCRIGNYSLVGAGSVVKEGQVFPDGVLIVGAPARIVRELTEAEINGIREGTQWYIDKGIFYTRELRKLPQRK